ncbi:DoxX family protein [Shinella sp.]|uniref:DoxX family protein n=1 Tax=Shinella sp. TaxID=1870904 RepID=UPI003F71A155
MSNSNAEPTASARLYIPSLSPLYDRLHVGAETLLRVVAGGLLITHGLPKILDPFGAAGMVESIGFYPGAFWSPLLSVSEFAGGVCLMLGLFTRFAALVTTIILLVTVYFHGVLQEQGLFGAEKSILWAAITLFFVVRGANRHSLDHLIGRQI